MKDIQFATFYGLIVFKYLNNGKMISTEIHKKIKMVIQKQCNVL